MSSPAVTEALAQVFAGGTDARAAAGSAPSPSSGEAGATVTVRGLLTGTMDGPYGWFFGGRGLRGALGALGLYPRRRWHRFPVSAFLITHPTRGPLLLDTGFAAGAWHRPIHHMGWVGTRVFRNARPSSAGTAAEQLAARGVTVELVLMTHLHWDHACALSDFPRARVLVAREEWLAANRPMAGLRGYLRRQLAGRGQIEPLDFDGPSAESWGPFRRTIDLFEDGSVRLLFTPGHSPGHLSVLLRLRSGPALLAGDALYTTETLTREQHPWQLREARAYGESIGAIATFARSHPAALVLPGHDLRAWWESGIEEGL